jgi:hypothetical protein
MKVIRVFKSGIGLNLMRDTKQVIKNNVVYHEYKQYTSNKVIDIKDMGYFYNNQRKQIKKEFKAKNVMALSNGTYEKCLYILKNGVLKIWRLNPNDQKALCKKYGYGDKRKLKQYFKLNNRKWGVI